MTPREYAVSLGLAQPGRGRFSAKAKEAIAAAEAAGTVFDDPKPAKAPADPATPKAERKTRQPKSQAKQWQNGDVVLVSDLPRVDTVNPALAADRPRRTDRMADAYVTADGIRKSVRDACGCGYSIGWCNCTVPTVFRGRNDKNEKVFTPLTPVLTRPAARGKVRA